MVMRGQRSRGGVKGEGRGEVRGERSCQRVLPGCSRPLTRRLRHGLAAALSVEANIMEGHLGLLTLADSDKHLTHAHTHALPRRVTSAESPPPLLGHSRTRDCRLTY